MPLEQIGNAITFMAHYTASGVSATGLTVTIDVYGGLSKIVTAGSATELGDGLYYYVLSSVSVTTENLYTAVFKTAGTADQQHMAAFWAVGKAGVENLDSSIAGVNTFLNSNEVFNSSLADIGAAAADAVGDELLTDHTLDGSFGEAFASAAAGGTDPLTNAVPGSYTTGTAGYVLGNLQDRAVNVVSPFNQSTSTVTIGYGEDYTSGSTNGLLSLATTASINLLTAGGTIYFSVRRKSTATNSDAVFTVTGTATAALTFTVSLTNTNTRALTPGTYLYTAWHVSAGAVRTELVHGDYVVGDLVQPTVS